MDETGIEPAISDYHAGLFQQTTRPKLADEAGLEPATNGLTVHGSTN